MKHLFIYIFCFIIVPAEAQKNVPVIFTIHVNDTLQQMRNIGASACWYGEEVGNWPEPDRRRMAELLFSRKFDKSGRPKGIGLSAFRFNIGAGTAEQGDSSGIRNPARRVECFLSPDGTYHWNKQQGYTWLLQQAKHYGVENLIAFVNSPPVQFTKNGLGYKTEKDYSSNLRDDRYTDYADFLAEVAAHFDKEHLHFNYISPVNEPQWDWSNKPGEATQEGSAWTNAEIYKVVKALSVALSTKQLTTRILVTEAGTLEYLYNAGGKAGKQVQAFFNSASPMYIGNLPNTTPYVEGHGYFTETGDTRMTQVRNNLRDTLAAYGHNLEFWQSEYCMLGDGFKDGTKGGRSAMDCALFLAKVINTDITEGNASAWHYWNSFEPGPADSNTRYYLVALNPKRSSDTARRYTITKNAWALGHYSLFVRPGMYRVKTTRNDSTSNIAAEQQIMISAFTNRQSGGVVVNMINYTTHDTTAALALQGNKLPLMLTGRYVTTYKEQDNLAPYPINSRPVNGVFTVSLPARSVSSFIFSRAK
ncbi:MAG TPA: glycoside hydrolase [Chitinophagaceae bacterium]|nr:glycoside hydrolase [Chitinophagaceae bacterium]